MSEFECVNFITFFMTADKDQFLCSIKTTDNRFNNNSIEISWGASSKAFKFM